MADENPVTTTSDGNNAENVDDMAAKSAEEKAGSDAATKQSGEQPGEDGQATANGGDEQQDGTEDVDAELEAIKRRVQEMDEEEAAKLNDIQEASAAEVSGGADGVAQADVDNRSVYVGNVDYGATLQELQTHFQDCGAINRVTILVNKFTGQAKGYAYIEFADEEAVNNAQILNDSMFRGRQLKVNPKRTNIHGYNAQRGRGGRGRGRIFRGAHRGSYRGWRYAPY